MAAKIKNPLDLLQNVFTSGKSSTFTASGAHLLDGVEPMAVTSSNATWDITDHSVSDDYTLSITATPTVTSAGPSGNLTIIINKDTPDQSSGTANGITYNAAKAVKRRPRKKATRRYR